MKNKRKMKSSSWILSIVLIIVIGFVSVPVYAAQKEGEKTTIAFWNFENSNLPEDASEENKEAEWIADTEKPVERKEPKNPPSGTEQGKVLETVGWKEGKSWRTVISTEGWQDVKLSYYTKVFDINTFLPVIGNHEQKGSIECQEMFTSMFSEFTERQDVHFCEGYNNTVWYYDDVKLNTRIFALNTNNPKEEHKITGKQLEWLKSNINPAMGQNIFIMHEPAYSTWHYGNALDRQVQARDEFWDVVECANNPMVFCGHEHLYSRKLINSRFDEMIGGNTYSHEKQVYQVHIGGFGGGGQMELQIITKA